MLQQLAAYAQGPKPIRTQLCVALSKPGDPDAGVEGCAADCGQDVGQ